VVVDGDSLAAYAVGEADAGAAGNTPAHHGDAARSVGHDRGIHVVVEAELGSIHVRVDFDCNLVGDVAAVHTRKHHCGVAVNIAAAVAVSDQFDCSDTFLNTIWG